jgi:hypothetical protein
MSGDQIAGIIGYVLVYGIIAALAGALIGALVYWAWALIAWLTGREFNL